MDIYRIEQCRCDQIEAASCLHYEWNNKVVIMVLDISTSQLCFPANLQLFTIVLLCIAAVLVSWNIAVLQPHHLLSPFVVLKVKYSGGGTRLWCTWLSCVISQRLWYFFQMRYKTLHLLMVVRAVHKTVSVLEYNNELCCTDAVGEAACETLPGPLLSTESCPTPDWCRCNEGAVAEASHVSKATWWLLQTLHCRPLTS